MITISNNNLTSSQRFRNKWIDGFTLALIAISTGAGFLSQPFAAEYLQLKATLRRDGNNTVIFNNTLKNLVALSHIESTTWNYLWNTGVVGVSLSVLAGVNTLLIPLRFDLGGPLNLIGDDELEIEWQLAPDQFWLAAANCVAATSYIQLDYTETLDIEWYTPRIESRVIEANQQNVSYTLGDNILKVLLLNYDKTGFTESTAVVNFVKFSADKFSKNDNYRELIDKAASYYSNVTEFAARIQNWILYSGSDELDNVAIDLNLNPPNVTAAKNFLVWLSFDTSANLVARAEKLEAMKQSKADKKVGFNPTERI